MRAPTPSPAHLPLPRFRSVRSLACIYCIATSYALYILCILPVHIIYPLHARLHGRRAMLDAPCAGTCFLCTYSPALAPARSHGALYTTARRPLAGHTLSSFCTLSLVLRSPLSLARALRSSCPRTLQHRPLCCMFLQNRLRIFPHFFCIGCVFATIFLFTSLPSPFDVARMSGLCDPMMPLSTSLGGVRACISISHAPYLSLPRATLFDLTLPFPQNAARHGSASACLVRRQ